MNSNCLLAFTKVMTHDRMRQLCSVTFCTAVIHCWYQTGTTGSCTVEFFLNYELEYFTEFHLFQACTWRLTMLQIYVTLWDVKMVCVCVCVWVCLELLLHFLPIKISLTNISPILIKIADFKNLAWATSFATRASRKFIYLPYRASGKKSYCHTLGRYRIGR